MKEKLSGNLAKLEETIKDLNKKLLTEQKINITAA